MKAAHLAARRAVGVRRLWVPGTVLALLLAALMLTAGTAAADGHDTHGLRLGDRSQPTACNGPGTSLVVSVTYRFVNDYDSAVGGTAWANDSIHRQLKNLAGGRWQLLRGRPRHRLVHDLRRPEPAGDRDGRGRHHRQHRGRVRRDDPGHLRAGRLRDARQPRDVRPAVHERIRVPGRAPVVPELLRGRRDVRPADVGLDLPHAAQRHVGEPGDRERGRHHGRRGTVGTPRGARPLVARSRSRQSERPGEPERPRASRRSLSDALRRRAPAGAVRCPVSRYAYRSSR